MQPNQQKRIKRFRKWWSANKTHRPSHHWLVKHTKRIMNTYNIGAQAWDKAKAITKRYNLSDYKKLSRSDAWFLWRITHPLHTERVERLLATAVFLQEKLDEQQDKKQDTSTTHQQFEQLKQRTQHKNAMLADIRKQALTPDPRLPGAKLMEEMVDYGLNTGQIERIHHAYTQNNRVLIHINDVEDLMRDAMHEWQYFLEENWEHTASQIDDWDEYNISEKFYNVANDEYEHVADRVLEEYYKENSPTAEDILAALRKKKMQKKY